MDRTEIIVGADSKVAREYLKYLDKRGVPSIVVYRSGDGDFGKYFCVK